ncbi:hypothetical protein F443_01083 [Phytophthora nicotianae P1569]|uniref:Uncharacterized protein n=1 Tax=Phytophthora nicotianae P1569 TaxID=1317065 RepID=V9FXY2_PHYNI|nr:hypothetical protein F443_01083 [Phytophthora nicotianae P1569]
MWNAIFLQCVSPSDVAVAGKAGEKMVQRLIESKLKNLAKVRLDAEKKIAEMRMKRETMLSRQKVKKTEYSDDEVNEILPL